MSASPVPDRQARHDRYDVVIVGGGSAGCVIAARTSEDPRRRVLLVEAGPDPQPVPDVIADPRRQAEVVLQSPYVRTYEATRTIDGSTVTFVSGRVMGGGSAVNNMSVIRPIRRDFETWTRFGGAAWSYDSLLPILRAIEDDPDFGESPIHGIGGPLHLERTLRLDMPLADPIRALVDTCVEAGLPECPDLNVPEPLGVCASPYAVRDGRRVSAATAYLDPARGRPNLTIAADTTARRLVLEGRRVAGVELETPDGLAIVEAEQVVVSAGVYHSPQLLILSGIGPPQAIERLGLKARHELRGVGENYQDHAVVYMTFEGTSHVREDEVVPRVRVIAKSHPSMDHGDLHLFMRPAIRVAGLAPMLPVSIHLLEQRSRGRVIVGSAEVHDLPQVEPALLEHPEDVAAITRAMRLVADLVGRPRLRPYYGALLQPGPGEDWATYASSTFGNYHHGVGTCRMGSASDPEAVVDGQLRVHGLDNLWVADASVLPVIPHANTNLSAILVGEVAAKNLSATASTDDRGRRPDDAPDRVAEPEDDERAGPG